VCEEGNFVAARDESIKVAIGIIPGPMLIGASPDQVSMIRDLVAKGFSHRTELLE
jgi:hypothetical protein